MTAAVIRIACPALDSVPGLGFALLDAANQFIHLPLHELQIVMRQPGNGLF